MLTLKQKDLLTFLEKNIQSRGICPSYEEMRKAMGLQSKSGIHRLISALEERGFIRKLPNKARAIEIIKSQETPKKITTKDKPQNNGPFNQAPFFQNDLIEIPVYGKIAAGSPIEALREPTNHIKIPADLIGNGRHYALTIEGNSMNGVGIMHQDVAIICQSSKAENGQIVVALIDEDEVTLKKFFKDKNQISLEPANINYETKTYDESRVQIQGHLVCLQRVYD